MKLICGKPKLSTDFASGEMVISFPIFSESKRNAVDEIGELGDKLSVDVSKYRKKRSLDANAYCWVLIGKLAAKLNKPSTEIYRDAIKEVGDNYEVVCVIDKAVDKLRRSWQHNGLGWITETMSSKIEGCTNVMLYYGSSTYDTAQMSRLLNIIIDECKAQSIDVQTPNEVANLLSLWESSYEKHNTKQ